MSSPRLLGVVLFPGFELLDVFGPLEVFGNLRAREHFRTCTVAAVAGEVQSAQGARAIADHGLAEAPTLDLLLVPGGMGTRTEVENAALLEWLRARAAGAEIVMSVCTGAALLARAGLLDGHRATTNKFAFPWVATQGPKVDWVRQARWVDAGRLVTSSGVTAGIDMALAVVARLHGMDLAESLATFLEHDWHRDPSWDPFAKLHGLV